MTKLRVPGGIDDASTRALVDVLDERWSGQALGVDKVLVWRVDSTDPTALPFLAEHLGIDGPEFQGGTNRDVIKRGVELRRKRGVPGILRDVLRKLDFGEVELLEHPRKYYDGAISYDGTWNHGLDGHQFVFIVVIDVVEAMSLSRVRQLWDAIDTWKRQVTWAFLGFRIAGHLVIYRDRDELEAVDPEGITYRILTEAGDVLTTEGGDVFVQE